jgi:hypothetical protein
MAAPTFPGCLISARLIGGIRARQREGRLMIRNDGLIAVPETAVNPAPIRSIHAGPSIEAAEAFHDGALTRSPRYPNGSENYPKTHRYRARGSEQDTST